MIVDRLKRSIDYRLFAKAAKERERHILGLLPKLFEMEEAEIKMHQGALLKQLLQYARKRSPYYKKLLTGIDFSQPSCLHKIPSVDKQAIREIGDDFHSRDCELIDHPIRNTGGSTGEPFAFPGEYNLIDQAHQEFQYRVMGYEEGDTICGFGGLTIPQEQLDRNIYWEEREVSTYGHCVFSSVYLGKKTIPYYIEKIMSLQPAILKGYPSFIDDLGSYMLQHNISCDFKVKGVEVTAENTFGHQIERISQAFNSTVFFQYGHTETSVFAFTRDESQEYYCSPFYGIVEVLDDDDNPVGIGQEGEVVTTGFVNFLTPFIRYRTGDRAVYGGERGGITMLTSISGRTQDYVVNHDGDPVALTALVFGQHYHAFQRIEKWQMHQDTVGTVTFKIKKAPDYTDKDEDEIRQNFKVKSNVDVQFEYGDAFELTRSGKFKFLIQKLEW